jgi:NitT/TauT family transport system substrate-binding protein
MRSKIFVVGTLAAALCVASATQSSAQEKATLRLNWLLSGVHSIFYYGVEKGFYADEKIELTIGEGQGSARAVQVVATGGDTFGVADGGSIIGAATRGAPVKAVLGIMNTSPYGMSFRTDSGVRTIKDAEGKTIAGTAGEASMALLPAIWQQNGVDATKVRILNVDGPGKLVAIMEKRSDGILAGLEGQVVILNQRGLDQKVFSFAELGVNTQGLTIVASNDTIEKKKDLVAGFVRATVKAMQATKADPDAAVAAASKARPDADKALVKAQLLASLKLLPSPVAPTLPLGQMAPEDWKRTLDLMKAYQDVSTTLTPESFYTNAFVAK